MRDNYSTTGGKHNHLADGRQLHGTTHISTRDKYVRT